MNKQISYTHSWKYLLDCDCQKPYILIHMNIFKSTLFFIICILCLQNVSSQTYAVSGNKRFLVREGKPFFWMGDTAWELFHRLDREDAEYYLKKRAAQGFTVIQAVALAEFDGLLAPNAYGEVPLKNMDPTLPNEAYFKHVDFIIDQAAELGLTIAFLPTWGDKINKMQWGKGPEIFTVANAKEYGKWLGMRYKTKNNIIWILGGDRNPRAASEDVSIWRSMASGIEEGCGGADNAMISFHPQPSKLGASEWFHKDNWLDFNMFQTGHCRDLPVYNNISNSYNLLPTKPTIDGEPIYEDHPVCFNARELGTSNALDVRKAAYLDLFAGAFGHTYGCHDIWQMYSPNKEAVNGPHIYWQQALDLPGANQMKYVRALIESRPFLDRVPDQSMIVENNLIPSERIQATRGADYAFIYTAAGKSFTVYLNKISGTQLLAYWYNPRNGKTAEPEKIENKGTKLFTPPGGGYSSAYGNDWVLILDDAAKKYSNPQF